MNDRPRANALFIDTTNSARSQMGQALLRYYAGDHFNTYSAGIEPQEIAPQTFAVMEEIGVSMAGQKPEGVRTYLGQKHFGYVFTVCDYALSQCPSAWLQAQHHMHWNIPDPLKVEGSEDEVLDAFRQARDELDEHVRSWLADKGIEIE
ncbi:MAG: arsenate reductase ArsC [Candidatus Promineifilaceae bacterium]